MSELYQKRGFVLKARLLKGLVFVSLLLGSFGRVWADDSGIADFLNRYGDLLVETFLPSPQGLIQSLYSFLLPVAIFIGLVVLAINGYGLMTSEGDPRKVQTAKENIFSAIMGLIFVLLAMIIYNLIVGSLIG